MSTQTDTANTPDIPPGEFLGHPKALWQLSNIEMWERFAYYGMRALLAVYVATTFFNTWVKTPMRKRAWSMAATRRWCMQRASSAVISLTMCWVTSDPYCWAPLSWLPGLFVLLIEDLNWFLVGLALIVAGNGLFKPNISTMIGKLYAPGDIRRDSGFTIFYMGINLGAFIAPFITAAWIGATWGLKYGFLAAGIGMILSTLFLEVAKKSLGHIGLPPKDKEGWGRFFAVGAGAIVMAGVVFFLLSESRFSATCWSVS